MKGFSWKVEEIGEGGGKALPKSTKIRIWFEKVRGLRLEHFTKLQ